MAAALFHTRTTRTRNGSLDFSRWHKMVHTSANYNPNIVQNVYLMLRMGPTKKKRKKNVSCFFSCTIYMQFLHREMLYGADAFFIFLSFIRFRCECYNTCKRNVSNKIRRKHSIFSSLSLATERIVLSIRLDKIPLSKNTPVSEDMRECVSVYVWAPQHHTFDFERWGSSTQ